MPESRESVERTMLDEARSEVSFADQKASMLLAILGIGLGALLGGFIADKWNPETLEGAPAALWWIGAALAVTSIGLAGAAVWPRYRRPIRPGLVHYWGDVAAYRTEQSFAAAGDDQFPSSDARTRSQLWRLSRIVSLKYLLLRLALSAAVASGAFFLLSALIGR